MIDKDDWRLSRWQIEYLEGEFLKYSKYEKYSDRWDHDHCEFCWEKFSEEKDNLHEGYCTLDKKYWICEQCYHDFKDMFKWVLVL